MSSTGTLLGYGKLRLELVRTRSERQRPAHRIAAQDRQAGQFAAQAAEGVGHRAVVHLALHVDEEDVVAQPPLRGPRFDLGEVDAAEGELLQDEEQGARLVLDDLADHARSCRARTSPAARVAGRGRRSGSRCPCGPRCRRPGPRSRTSPRPAGCRWPPRAGRSWPPAPLRWRWSWRPLSPAPAGCCAARRGTGRWRADGRPPWLSGPGSPPAAPGAGGGSGCRTSRTIWRLSISWARMSTVAETEPSMEFSMGTIAQSTSPGRHRFDGVLHRGEGQEPADAPAGGPFVDRRSQRHLGERARRPEEADGSSRDGQRLAQRRDRPERKLLATPHHRS